VTPPSTSTAASFTVLDWIGAALAAITALALFAFAAVGPSYAAMFRDLGTAERLSTLTTLAISGWFPAALGVVVSAGAAAGARLEAPLGTRRALVVVACVGGAVGIGACLVGAYLPIFALAGAIKSG
jgi:hypothetical protein